MPSRPGVPLMRVNTTNAPASSARLQSVFTPLSRSVAPRTSVEQKLARIWEAVLVVAPVGLHDGFLDLGGASLDAARIGARVEAELGGGVPTATLLGASTVAGMALAVVEALARAAPGALDRVEGGLDVAADLP